VAIGKLYSDDYFHTNPDGTVMDKAAVIASYRAPSEFQFTSSERQQQRVQIHDDCAVVNARLVLKGKKGGEGFTSEYRITYVLHQFPDGWKVTNSHATLLGIKPD